MQTRMHHIRSLMQRYASTKTPSYFFPEDSDSSSLKWIMDFVKSKSNVLIATGVGLVAINWLGSTGYENFYSRAVLDRLSRGVLPPPTAAHLPRKAVYEEVYSAMHPEKPNRFFSLILGAPGSGKSTLVRNVCVSMGGGVGYVDVKPTVSDFGLDLGEAFSFRLERHVNIFNVVSQAILGRKTVEFTGGSGNLASLRRSCEALDQAARMFRNSTGDPFVLVLDSVDRLKEWDDQVLRALIEYAKDWSRDGIIHCVFVARRYDTAHAILGEHPVRGRASIPVYVPDITQSEGLELMKHFGIDEIRAKQVIDLVGGSLVLVERAADLLTSGKSLDEVKDRLIELMAFELDDFDFGDENSSKTSCCLASVLRKLVASPDRTISASEWRRLVPEGEARHTLLSGGLLEYDGQKVRFSSELAHLCVEERIGGMRHKKSDGCYH